MKGFWLGFTDGSSGYCEGVNAYDAMAIAQKLTGKTVAPKDPSKPGNQWTGEGLKVDPLPYPATPIIWQLDHPVSGKCPPFCYSPAKCKGQSSCFKQPACSE